MPAPLACSLSGSALARRQELLDELRLRALAIDRTPDGIVARFRAGPGLERDLHALVRAEAECCPFLDLRIVVADDALELRVSGPPEARPVIEMIFAPLDVA
jgi:hypothetical protein